MTERDAQITAEDLFRPFTIEKWVEKFVSDFDEIVKQGAAVYLLKNEGSTVLGAMFWNLAGFSEPGRDSYLVFSCSCINFFTHSDLV